jgi:hypothetical protein
MAFTVLPSSADTRLRGIRHGVGLVGVTGAEAQQIQTLFARADWIDKAWQIVDPIVERGSEVTGPLSRLSAVNAIRSRRIGWPA